MRSYAIQHNLIISHYEPVHTCIVSIKFSSHCNAFIPGFEMQFYILRYYWVVKAGSDNRFLICTSLKDLQIAAVKKQVGKAKTITTTRTTIMYYKNNNNIV